MFGSVDLVCVEHDQLSSLDALLIIISVWGFLTSVSQTFLLQKGLM